MKKQFSKKKLMTFGVLGLFAIMLVSAAVYLFVGSASVDGQVDEALSVTGTVISFTDAYPGEVNEQTIEITNKADVPLKVNLNYVEQSNNYVLDAALIPFNTEMQTYTGFEAGKDTITIVLPSTIGGERITLADLRDISFEQFVTEGYPASVNILLDVNGDGVFESRKDLTTGLLTDGADDVLKIEFFGNGATASFENAYMEDEDYNRWLHVFGEGMSDDTTVAWLYSKMPGPPEQNINTLGVWKSEEGIQRGTSCYEFVNGQPLGEGWKENYCEDVLISGSTLVYGIEIESLGWIAASGSKIRNIDIGGESYGADGVDYTNSLPGNSITIPAFGEVDNPAIIGIDFTITSDSPTGEFTGKINVERTA